MKKVLSIVIVFFICGYGKAQTHILKYPCQVYECNIDGSGINESYEIAPASSKLDSIKLDPSGKYVIIKFWKWTPPKANEKSQEFVVNQLNKINKFNYTLSGDENINKIAQANIFFKNDLAPFKYFAIKIEDLKTYAVRNIKITRFSFTSGVLTIPFKIRAKPSFDFSKDFTMAASGALGYDFGNNFALYFTMSLGISSISADSSNTEGKIIRSTNLSAFTATPGLVFAWKNLQISANLGWDYLSDKDKDKNWVYDKRTWIGLGIGYLLFQPQNSSGKTPSADESQESN